MGVVGLGYEAVRNWVGEGTVAVDSGGCEVVRNLVGEGSVAVPVETGSVGGRVSVHRPGIVEGTRVCDVVLDTGCS